METLYVVLDPSSEDTDQLASLIQRLQPRARVVRASGGEEALNELVRMRAAPSMIFTAFDLDDMNAIELLGALRQRRWLASTPVAVLAEAVDDRRMVQTYRLGAAVFLDKPVAVHALRDAIREHARTSQWLSAASFVPGSETPWRRAA